MTPLIRLKTTTLPFLIALVPIFASPTATSTCPPVAFSSGTTITIPDSGNAIPYPSSINVAGLVGTITKVTVTINGLSHTYPDDLDFLLVGPGGQNAKIWSDAGGSLDVVGVNVVLDTAAASQLPDSAQITSGSWRPADYEPSTDVFPAPAPVPSGNVVLSVFNGLNPNGTWSLYLVDDAAADMGSISGGWTLTITTDGPCGTPTPTCTPGPWSTATPYPTTIARYGSAQTATHFYVFGGVSNGTRVNNVNRLVLATGMWEARAPMPFTSEAPTCALMESTGIVYCTEGDTGSGFASYNIATNTWTPLASIPGGDHYGSASGAFNGKVFVAGGTTGIVADVQVYNVASNMWSAGTAAPSAFLLAGYHQEGQFLYVVGGFDPSGPNAAEQSSVLKRGQRSQQPKVPLANKATTYRLDMTSAPGVWSTGPAFAQGRADFGLAYDAGTNKLYALGGDAGGGGFFDSTNLVDELSLASWPAGSWMPSPPNLILPNRQANQAGFYGSGQIWSVGGIVGQTFQFLAEVWHRSNGGGCIPSPYDFNHDAKPDFVLYTGITRQTAVLYMNNNILVGGAIAPILPAGWSLIDVADFDRDGNNDYAVFNFSTRQTAILYLSGVTLVGGALGPTLPNGWTLVATGDFNADGNTDYVLYNSSTHQTAILYLNNNVLIGGDIGPTLPNGWGLAGVADFNHDGHMDYALFISSTGQTVILYLSGPTVIGAALGPSVPISWPLVGVADFNGDGNTDYVLYNSSTRQTAILYLNNNVLIGGDFGPTLPNGWSLVAP